MVDPEFGGEDAEVLACREVSERGYATRFRVRVVVAMLMVAGIVATAQLTAPGEDTWFFLRSVAISLVWLVLSSLLYRMIWEWRKQALLDDVAARSGIPRERLEQIAVGLSDPKHDGMNRAGPGPSA